MNEPWQVYVSQREFSLTSLTPRPQATLKLPGDSFGLNMLYSAIIFPRPSTATSIPPDVAENQNRFDAPLKKHGLREKKNRILEA